MTRSLTLDRFLPYRLSVAANAVSTRIADAYQHRFGLKISEWRILAVLGETDRLTSQTLTDRTRMDKIAVSRAATALLNRGLLSSTANPADGRSHFLSLTETGRALYDDIAPTALTIERHLFATLSAEERVTLEAILRRIETAAS